jgi:putative oxidoreductase
MEKAVKKICDKNIGLLVMRIGLGGIFLLHGILKLAYMSTTINFFGQLGFAPVWAWVVALVEVIGGLMILIGAFTWVAGLLLAVVMVVAFVRVKLPLGGMQAFMAGEVDIVLFIMAIGLGLSGPGRYAVASLKKGSTATGTHTCAEDCACEAK